MTALLSVVLTLDAVAPTEANASVARAAHAWLLARIAEHNPALAARLHEADGPRPFTVSNLWGAGRARDGLRALAPGQECWLRFTALTTEMAEHMERALEAPGATLDLAGARLVVRSVAVDAAAHPWAGRATYGELLEQHTLSPGPLPRSVTLRFASPTLFRRQGRDLPLPLPELVFDGYLRKWNTFAPLALPEEAKRYAQECVALSKYRLRSRFISFEGSGKGGHVGFTGEARFRFLTGDAYWTRVMSLLAGYAFWCGTGYRTTVGFGQTQALRGSPVDSVGT